MKEFTIGKRTWGYLNPYIIAEIGVNHEGDLARAKKMIDAIASSGGHAAKFQTYKADKLAVPDKSPSYWDRSKEPAPSQHALFKRYDSFGLSEYAALAEHCHACGIDFISTPFDLDAAQDLAPLMPAFKIASADITNVPLLRAVARHHKPIIMSTGAATDKEVIDASRLLEAAGAESLALLHCVLNYPTPKKNAQMSCLTALASTCNTHGWAVGYSDHVPPNPDRAMPSLEMAVVLGAVIIEKHFTDDKTLPGNDHYHAMDAADLSAFTEKIRDYRTLFGSGGRNLELEKDAIKNARRRIVTSRAISAGSRLSEQDLIPLRAQVGIEVVHWDAVLDRSTKVDLPVGHVLQWNDLV